MMQSRGAAQYRAVSNHGLVADASPARLVQIMYEEALTQLVIAKGCMERISNNLPLKEVVTKGKAMSKAIRLINHLNGTLDMERGGEIAANLRSLYVYMLARLTLANAALDASIVTEVIALVSKVKSGWDGIVKDAR
jgi:flagellar secretion chaperone FliS